MFITYIVNISVINLPTMIIFYRQLMELPLVLSALFYEFH